MLAEVPFVNSMTTSGRNPLMDTKRPRVEVIFRVNLQLESTQVRPCRPIRPPSSFNEIVEALKTEVAVDLLCWRTVRASIGDLIKIEEVGEQVLETVAALLRGPP
jgi:hypothetical protein